MTDQQIPAIVISAEDESLARLIAIDAAIDASETDGIMARWEFGQKLLEERHANGGKQLPHGRLEEVCEATGKSRSEIQYRMQFAEKYPTPEKVSTVVDTSPAWTDIRDSFAGNIASNESRGTDEYFTPAWIFDALDIRFDLDVCSPPEGTDVPCDRYIAPPQDGLLEPWEGVVWMNPPYSNVTPWVTRFIDHANGIALLPFAKSAWFYRLWDHPDTTLVTAGPKASTFNGGTISMPVFLAALGPPATTLTRLGHTR